MHRAKSTKATTTEELPLLDLILAEGRRLQPSWREGLFDLRLSGVPMNDGDDEDETLTKKEADKLKKANAKKDREVRDKQQELDQQGERITALEEKLEAATDSGGGGDEGGNNKALEARIDKAEQRAEKAEAKADAAEAKRVEAEQTATAVDVATRLNFRNPKRAIKQLDSDNLTDEDSIESALEQLATEEPYMVASKKQRPVDDDKKPKAKKAKKADDAEDDEKPKTGDDEPVGKARIKQAYDEAEAGDESGDESGSDD